MDVFLSAQVADEKNIAIFVGLMADENTTSIFIGHVLFSSATWPTKILDPA
jgi:hypothetical protein